MGDVFYELSPQAATFPAAAFPQFTRNYGTNGPVTWLAYDATVTESAYWELTAFAYGSGPLSLDIIWGAATATSGAVRWSAQVACISPGDAQDPETKAYAAASTVDVSHLGSSAKRLMRATIEVANVDAIAAGDEVWVKISRVGGIGGNLTGDAWLKSALLSYSDV
jgi:hypothetical protein